MFIYKNIKFKNKHFYKEPFFWYLFDSIFFGFILGAIANHLHDLNLLDLNFIILSTSIRITISSYQLNRFYKDLEIFNLFFIFNFTYIVITILLSKIFLIININLISLVIISLLSYLLSLVIYKIALKETFLKFIISYYFRIAIFFSGLFFDPLLFLHQYKIILYLNPFYWFYLIFI